MSCACASMVDELARTLAERDVAGSVAGRHRRNTDGGLPGLASRSLHVSRSASVRPVAPIRAWCPACHSLCFIEADYPAGRNRWRCDGCAVALRKWATGWRLA